MGPAIETTKPVKPEPTDTRSPLVSNDNNNNNSDDCSDSSEKPTIATSLASNSRNRSSPITVPTPGSDMHTYLSCFFLEKELSSPIFDKSNVVNTTASLENGVRAESQRQTHQETIASEHISSKTTRDHVEGSNSDIKFKNEAGSVGYVDSVCVVTRSCDKSVGSDRYTISFGTEKTKSECRTSVETHSQPTGYSTEHGVADEIRVRTAKRTATLEDYRQRRLENARQYIKQSMLVHLVILIIAIGFESLFLALCTLVTPRSPHSAVRLQADVLQAAQAQLEVALAQTPKNETAISVANSDLDREVAAFREVVLISTEQGRKLFMWEAVFTGASLLSIFVLAVAVYCHRHHPVVRSRGRMYLVLIFTLATLMNFSSLIMAGGSQWQFGQFRLDLDYRDRDVLNRQIDLAALYVYLSFMIAIALISMYFSSIALRLRMISLVYSSKLRQQTVKGARLLMWAFGWAVLSFFITIPAHTYWLIVDRCHPRGIRYTACGLLAISLVVYPLVFTYIYRARHASLKFNDMFSNIRAMIVIFLVFFSCFSFTYCNPHHTISSCSGWCSVVRLVVSVQVLDQFSTQVLQAKWEIPARPKALQDLKLPGGRGPVKWFHWTSRMEPTYN